MNRTHQIAVFNNNPIEIKEFEEAFSFLKELYPNIEYVKETDSFIYRGIIFDYFKAGINIFWPQKGKFSGSYLLIDPNNPMNNWLFTYGNLEERWNDFIKRKTW